MVNRISEKSMLKFILVLFAALCLGIGSGYAQRWWEFDGVDERFSVFKETLDSNTEAEPFKDPSSEAKVPTAEVVGKTIFNFGSLEKGETGKHTFVFKNTGTGPLKITLTSTSCSCTLSDLKGQEKTIYPGDSFPVELSYKSDNWAKRFRQSATIETNDPARRTINLYVEGVILQPIRPEPDKVVFSNTTPSEVAEARIRLYGYKWKDVEIEKLEFTDASSADFFTAEYTPLPPEELQKEINSQCGYLITVKTKKGLSLGPLRQTLKIVTNKEVLDIPINGKVTGEFIISMIGNEFPFDEERNQIRLGKLAGDTDVSVDLVLSTSSKLGDEIELSLDESETYPSSQHIKVEILKDKFRKIGRLYQYPIKVTVPKDCPNVSLLGPAVSNLGRFVLHTTHPTEKRIEIYILFAKTR